LLLIKKEKKSEKKKTIQKENGSDLYLTDGLTSHYLFNNNTD